MIPEVAKSRKTKKRLKELIEMRTKYITLTAEAKCQRDLFISPLVYSAGPPLKETVKFIAEKLLKHGHFDFSRHYYLKNYKESIRKDFFEIKTILEENGIRCGEIITTAGYIYTISMSISLE